MSVLKKYFDKKSCHGTPIQVDMARVVKYDEDGTEFVTYEKVDYPKIVASNGNVADWSLESLLKAGVNPGFSIHTGFNTRLEGLDTLNSAADALISALDEEKSE